MRKLVAAILIVALCQTQIFATAVVPGDLPPQVPDANGRVSEDAFKALSLPQQVQYIQARQAVLFAHDTRIDVLNGNNFDNQANAVESYRAWAKVFRVLGFILLVAATIGNIATPALQLANVGGSNGATTYQSYVQFGCALAIAIGAFLVGYANTFTTRANDALAIAVVDNDDDAKNLIALKKILEDEQRALNNINDAYIDVFFQGPLERNEALQYFGYRVRQILDAMRLPANGLDRLVQFARMQNTGTREQALAYLHMLLRDALFHPERMARIVVPHEGMVPVEEGAPAIRNANLMALATVRDHVERDVEPARPAAAPPPKKTTGRKTGKVKVYYTWATPAPQPQQPPQPPPKDDDKEKQDDVELKPAGNQTDAGASNNNAEFARFGGAGGASEL
jgi:hypothetical protein